MRVTPKTLCVAQITVRSRFLVRHALFGVTRVRIRNYRFMNVGWLDGLSDCLCWKISCHNVHRSSLAHLCGWYPCDWTTCQCLYSFSHIQGSPYLLEPGKFGCVFDKPCNCQISYCTLNIWLQYLCHAPQNYALLKCQSHCS